ncbi:MAG: alpha/beta fold hydrolase [Caldilineaceae bacterium]|nr:alpha/beta fold hydrolase [Caldilineaceae bacterium]
MTQTQHVFDSAQTRKSSLTYWLHLPTGYGDDPDERWPLILFLHGAGERGDDAVLVKKHGIVRIADEQPDFPFVAVSPQCPLDHWWSDFIPELAALLDEVQATHAVDADRVYLTGLSMGAFGSWHLATEYPERFAAAALICGAPPWHLDMASRAVRVKDMPLWFFHGDADDVVSIVGSRAMVDAVHAAGGDPQFTIYPGVAHDSWTETYDNPALYEWFLSKERMANGERA